MKNEELYYTPPPDEIFEEVKKEVIKQIENEIDEEYENHSEEEIEDGEYDSSLITECEEKIEKLSNLKNIGDNIIYLLLQISMFRQNCCYKQLSEEAKKEITKRRTAGSLEEQLKEPYLIDTEEITT